MVTPAGALRKALATGLDEDEVLQALAIMQQSAQDGSARDTGDDFETSVGAVTDLLDVVERMKDVDEIWVAAILTLSGIVKNSSPDVLKNSSASLLPPLVSSLGRSHKTTPQISKSLWTLWLANHTETEQALREYGLTHRSTVTRIASLSELTKWVDALNNRIAFRKFTPLVVRLLRDEDAALREMSYNLLVQFFATAKPAAREDLAEIMRKQQISEAVHQRLMSAISRASPKPSLEPGYLDNDRASSPHRQKQEQEQQEKLNAPSSSNPTNLKASFVSATSAAATAPMAAAPTSRPTARTAMNKSSSVDSRSPSPVVTAASAGATLDILDDPQYPMQPLAQSTTVYSDEQFASQIRSSLACFEGKETEHNWSKRQQSVQIYRQMLRGTAHRVSLQSVREEFKLLQKPLSTTILSMRTTLVMDSCQAVKDTAHYLESDPISPDLFDPLLDSLAKVASGVKKITAAVAHVTICAILISVPTISSRQFALILQEVKSLKPHARYSALYWLKIVILKAQDKMETQLEREAEIASIMIKALADADPKVRELAREVYWIIYAPWPDLAATVVSRLGASAARALQASKPRELPVVANIKAANADPSPALSRVVGSATRGQLQPQASVPLFAPPPNDILGSMSYEDELPKRAAGRPASPRLGISRPSSPRQGTSRPGSPRIGTPGSSSLPSRPNSPRIVSPNSLTGNATNLDSDPESQKASLPGGTEPSRATPPHRAVPQYVDDSIRGREALATSSSQSPVRPELLNWAGRRTPSPASEIPIHASSLPEQVFIPADPLPQSLADLSMNDQDEPLASSGSSQAPISAEALDPTQSPSKFDRIDFTNLDAIRTATAIRGASKVLRQLALSEESPSAVRMALKTIKDSAPSTCTSVDVARVVQEDLNGDSQSQRQREGYLNLLKQLNYEEDTVDIDRTRGSLMSSPRKLSVFRDEEGSASASGDSSRSSIASSLSEPDPKTEALADIKGGLAPPFPTSHEACRGFIADLVRQVSDGSAHTETLAALAVLITAAGSPMARMSAIRVAVSVWLKHAIWNQQLCDAILPFLSQGNDVKTTTMALVLLRVLTTTPSPASGVDPLSGMEHVAKIALAYSGLSLSIDEHLLIDISDALLRSVDGDARTSRIFSLLEASYERATKAPAKAFFVQTLGSAVRLSSNIPAAGQRVLANVVLKAVEDRDATVRKEAYPVLIAISRYDQELYASLSQQLRAGQQRLLNYYIEVE